MKIHTKGGGTITFRTHVGEGTYRGHHFKLGVATAPDGSLLGLPVVTIDDGTTVTLELADILPRAFDEAGVEAVEATLGRAYEPPVAARWDGDVLTLTTPRELLKVENAKLRELVRAAWKCIHVGLSCSDCRMVAGGCTLQSAMRELGVEVSE